MVNEISDKPKDSIHETAELIRRFIESSIDDVRAIGFYGSDMPLNSMKWFLVSQLLHLAQQCDRIIEIRDGLIANL